MTVQSTGCGGRYCTVVKVHTCNLFFFFSVDGGIKEQSSTLYCQLSKCKMAGFGLLIPWFIFLWYFTGFVNNIDDGFTPTKT